MKKTKYYVDHSPIHGKGLFAKEKIRKGEILGTIKRIKTDKNGPYTLWLDEETGVHVTGPFKYINHSVRPNVVYYDTLEVGALRDIKPGEELTHDYQEAEFD